MKAALIELKMQLAFHLGRTIGLAKQEVLSLAPTLSFPWTSPSVSGELLLLKPTGDEAEWLLDDLARLQAAQDLVLPLQERLGGTMRIIWFENKLVERPDLITALARLAAISEGRSVGVSIWGDIDIHKFGIKLKRVLKEEYGKVVRIVLPRESNQLTPAQLAGERLAAVPRGAPAKGVEVVAFNQGGQWRVGVTLTASNIDFYSKRDFGIPAPDPVSGMLPSKLAQMMINLAVGGERLHVHDPFCGNGRIVLEAALMELAATGSDIEEAKVEAARRNLEWLGQEVGIPTQPNQLWVADATDTEERDKIITAAGPNYVLVGEPYLGKALRSPLPTTEQAAWLAEVTKPYLEYLTCWAEAAVQPRCHLLVMPRVKVADGSEMAVSAAIVDRLNQVGYSAEVLFCYDRPDAIVRRDIVRLKKSQVR